MAEALPESVEWRRDDAPVPYRAALAEQEARNAAIAAGEARELIWLLEHPSVYTAGTSAPASELLDLAKRGRDVRCFVHALEGWVIETLGDFGVESWRAEGRIGIWTRDVDGGEAKIGAIGVRIRRWVTMHGFAVNLDPDLAHFGGIVPCGIAEYGVTSLAKLGIEVAPEEWDRALQRRADGFLAALGRSECPA